MRKLGMTLIALSIHTWCLTAHAEPPKVTMAVPDNGAVNVDPSLKEIRVTFDQPMSRGGMSIVGGGDQFPEIEGRPNWVNDRTIAVKVKLKPNRDYWLSINNARFQNFKNQSGEAAIPYPLRFRTARAGAIPKSTNEAANRRAVEIMRTAVRDKYSYRDRLSIDWEKLFKTNEAALIAAETPVDFAKVAATLLAQAKDKHIWLAVGDETIPSYINPSVPNANYKLLPTIVPAFKKHGKLIASGRWDDGIGYLAITTWDRSKIDDGKPIFDALKELTNTKALIIDVRTNGGGAEPLAQEFAGCFTSEPRLYAKDVFRDPNSPGGFTQPKERWLKPTTNHTKYAGRVAVLSGPAVMSSCESFLLMMKQVPGTIVVGVRSQGSSGNPKPHDLENGVTLFLPSWKDLTADGKELEGVGIAADVEVNASPNDFRNDDPVLKAALENLRSSRNK